MGAFDDLIPQRQAGAFDDLIPEPSSASAKKPKRTWGEAATDTAVQLAEGVNTIAGAVPNLVAPESRTAEFFRDNADYWRQQQSDPLKQRISTADKAIQAAGEDGIISQISEAASQYFKDPALAARFVTTNLPSLIPGIGAAKVAQGASLAMGASAMRAASVATTAAGATNAVLNAGGARGEAFEDIKRTLVQQGYTPEQAETMALEDSRVVAAVGAITGYISGKTGLEGSLFGKATGKSAVKAGTSATVAELAGEQIEEVTPKVATNYQASQYDRRNLGQDVGRTIVETAIGSGPGSALAGVKSGLDARANRPVPAEVAGAQPPQPAAWQEPGKATPGAFDDLIPTQAQPSSQKPAMRPEARLAELDLLGQTRDLTEAEQAEAGRLVQELVARDNQDAAAQPAAEPAAQAPAETQPLEQVSQIAPAAPGPVQADASPDASAAPAAPVIDDSRQILSASRTDSQPEAMRVTVPPASGIDPNLQNRDRGRAASVAQMAEIARSPDYMRLATSRTPDAGAPMVFAVGDDLAKIPPGNEGQSDVAVMADGQRVAFRYAVVDASQVDPSHFADGRLNPAFTFEVNGTLKALNNARTAGLRAAYEMGTAAEYKRELIADAAAHGVSLEAIERTPNPILVRVYSERSNTADMAAKSQGQGLGMSPGELARQDAPLIDSSVLAVYQPGDVASAANRDFVRAVVGKIYQAGQDVAPLMTAEGALSPAGRQRIQAALMQSAYGDADLVEELFDSLETDIKAIGEALKTVAGEWANMRDAARQGAINPQTDITDNLVQAVQLIRKARRERTSLYDLTRQPDLMTGEVPDPLTIGALRLFYRGEYLIFANGRDAVVAALRDYVRTSMGTTAGADMFGQVITPTNILDNLNQQGASNAQNPAQEGRTEPSGLGRPVLGTDTALPADTRLSREQAGEGAGADRTGKREDPARTDGQRREPGQAGDAANRLTTGQTKSADSRIEDVGQQLYANRRNFTGRGLKWEDVAELNDTLKLKEVTKAKVWPRPNYEQLVEQGMPPVLARMVKQVYDGLSAGPTLRSGAVTDEDLKRYIDTLAKVREGLFAFVNDRQQVADFAKGVLGMVKGDPAALGPVSILDMAKTAMDGQQVATVLLRRIWPEQFAANVSTLGRFPRGSEAHKEASILGGSKAMGALQFTRSDISKWVADLGKGWPTKREAWQVQGYRVLAPGEYTAIGQEQSDGTTRLSIRLKEGRGSWRATFTDAQLTEPTYLLVQDGGFTAEPYASREAAIEAARNKVKRSPGVGQDIRGTNIEDAERIGPARRQEREDISAKRLMDTFGFRGVNFGREGWIKQAERQAYLNQAHDGLLDLAEVLGVPPKAMSLNGELGIAFGAQGKGKASAHFVPGVNEINLTRTRGAGTLAHEWGHALDHYFGKQAGLAKDADPFLSEHAKGAKVGGEIRPEIVESFRAIYQAMEKRAETIGEAGARRDAALVRTRKNLEGWMRVARSVIEGSTAANKRDLLSEFDQHAQKLREGDTGDGYEQAGKQVFSTRVAAIRNLIKDATGRVWSTDETRSLESNASYLKSLLAKKEADAEHEPQKVATQYKRDSLAMDQEKGGKAYWSTPAEMLARAFELYVHDKLSQRGTTNTFLTDAEDRASKPVKVADNSSAMARGSGAQRELYLYPVGKERETLRAAFDNLIGQIQTRETEMGSVAMFNRKNDENEPYGSTAEPSAERDRADIEALESLYDAGHAADIRAGGDERSARAVHPFRFHQFPVEGLGRIGAAFGKRIVGFSVRPGVLKQFGSFNGVTFPGGTGNRIFINQDSDRPHLAVLGHEMAHQMAKTRPDLYAQLVQAVRPYVKAGEYGADFASSPVARNSYPKDASQSVRDAAIREEFIGEILSDGFMDKAFWRALGSKNPALLQSVARFVAELIDTIKAKVGYASRTERYLSDYTRVMQLAGEVMAEYGMQTDEAPADGLPTFNRNGIGDNEPPQPGPWQENAWTRAKAKAMELTSPQAIDRLIYEFRDKYIDLKNLREHIQAIGGTITDLNDAYLGEELYHKRLSKRTEDFLDKELKPLLASMRSRGVRLPELERYLHARHAPEANRSLAERNPNRRMIDDGRAKAQADVRELELKLQSAVAKGMTTKAIEEALIEARAQASKWVGAQAFRGEEAQRLALSGMSDQEAKAFIDGLTPAKRAHLEALAKQVDQMQAKTLDMLEKYGLMDKETLNSWRTAYQFYVPLHRDEAHADSDRHPIGQGFSIKGKAARSRVGSNEKVTNILAHIAMQREAALTRGEKNTVVKKLYLMAAQNPDEDFWSIDNPPKIKTIDPNTGFVRVGVDPAYKHLPNVVMVRIAGQDQAIIFNEHNPQAVRLAEAMKNLDVGDLHVVLGLAAKGTRWFASVNTQYNPIFGLINFARDVQSGLLNLSTTELKGKTREVASHIPEALRAIYRERRGKSARNAEWARLWDEFQDVGGTTGYRDLYADAQDRAKSLEKDLAALDRGEVSKAAHAVVDWLSHYNETMENSVRLAAYKVAIDQGMSKERAASLAKNLTVNFNRKGRQAREIGALYAFFNAAIQGTARMAETLQGPLGKRIIYGGVLLGVVNTLIGMAAMGGGDDGEPDNWEKVPQFIKERSIIIPLGREDYLSIPMPLGFHVLPNIGRLAVEFALGGSDKTAGRQLGRLLQVLADAFNPLGGAQNLGQVVAPTVIDPAVALMQNRDWTGKPIYRETNSPLDPQPGHRMAKDSASTPSRLVAEAINRITGGTEYRPGAWSPTPDQLDYVIGQLTGGLGRELLKVNQTIASTVTGDELPPYKVPLLGRLYGNTRGPAGQADLYYENVKTLNELENEYKGRARNNQDPHSLMQEEPLARLVPMANSSEAAVRRLREYRRNFTERKPEGYQDKVREIDTKIGEIMARLNDAVSKARKENSRAEN